MILRWSAFVALLWIAAGALFLPGTLLLRAETLQGRLAGISATLIILSVILFLAFRLFRIKWKRSKVVCLVVFCIGVISILVCYIISPSGKIPQGNFSQHFSRDAEFSRLSVTNLIPEIDQLKLGSIVVPYLDPLIDAKQGKRVQELFLGIYREMEEDAAFREVGTVLGMCYEDIFQGKCRRLHFYEYVPRQLDKKSYPVLIFLHGSLGNFKGYMWVLKDLADTAGFAIIAPTYGCGNWYNDVDCSVLKSVNEYCRKNPELDESRMFLAGLSNGGTGVTRGVLKLGEKYMGFIYLSPVMEYRLTSSCEYAENSAGRGILIVHGEEDNRIPISIIKDCEKILAANGQSVESHYYPGEDHFLFFSKRKQVVGQMADWLARQK